MAEVPAAPAVNINVDRELTKIPLFYSDPKHDSFQPEYWIERLVRLKVANGWTNAQTCANALNALRGRALHFADYFDETYGGEDNNWNLFKEQFLFAFGKKARDTSNVANLAIMQRDSETVQLFAMRVVVTTREFFQSMMYPEEPDFAAAPAPQMQLAQNEQAQILVRHYVKDAIAAIRSSLNKTIFLNGIKKEINAMVKNTKPQTWVEAVENAATCERNQKGPIDHTIALEKDKSATSINHLRRGASNRGGRGRGFSSRGGVSRGGASNGTGSSRTNVECWYCKQPGHPQIYCKKRIARGAALVPRPRSVAEITAEDIGFQDEYGDEDDEQEPAINEDQDEYLNDALSDQHLDAINIAAIHLN